MEERKIALWVLGIIVVIAIVGLFFLFKAESTGSAIASANRNSMIPYPGGVYHPTAETYANPAGKVFPYARTAKPFIEEPSYVTTKKDVTKSRALLRGKCSMLSQAGIVSSEYSEDASYQQSRFKECVEVEGSIRGFCCKKTSYIY
jgi:hypothetical protein